MLTHCYIIHWIVCVLLQAVNDTNTTLPGSVEDIMNTWVLQMGFPVVTINTSTGVVTQKHFLLDPDSEVTTPSLYKYAQCCSVSPLKQWFRGGFFCLCVCVCARVCVHVSFNTNTATFYYHSITAPFAVALWFWCNSWLHHLHYQCFYINTTIFTATINYCYYVINQLMLLRLLKCIILLNF